MPIYRYQAVNGKGQTISGTMVVDNESILDRKLKALGLWVVEACVEARPTGKTTDTPSRAKKPVGVLWGKTKRRALINFCTMMSFQTKVGIPLVQAIQIAGEHGEHAVFQHTLADVRHQMECGSRFYEALSRHPKVFSAEFIGVIRAGESSGRLNESFRDLKKYIEWLDRVIHDVRQATLYPTIVFCIISVFVLSLFTFIVPKFAVLLKQMNIPLPLTTQIVFAVSDFVKNTWWIWTLLMLFLTVGIQVGRRYSRRFSWGVDWVKLKLPLFGELNSMLSLSRLAQNFVVLYRAGIPIIGIFEMCEVLVGNLVVGDAVAKMREDIKSGSTISEAMRRQAVFPPIMRRMTTLGETTGTLDDSLEELAAFYNEVVPDRIAKMLTVLEPCMMVFLIGIVMVVALAIYSPLLSMMSTLR